MEFEAEVIHGDGILHQVSDPLSRLSTENVDENPLHDAVSTMLIANDAELNSAYVCRDFCCKEEGLVEPALLLVAVLVKTTSYA